MSDYTKSFRLGLQVGDYVIYQGVETELFDGDKSLGVEVSPGMAGKVLKASDNPLAKEASKELGFHLDAAWALVQFENGKCIILHAGTKLEKVKVQ